MLRAQIGQCAVFKTPTKLQHPYCNSFEAIAIGKLDLVLDRRNVSLFRDLATEPIFTLRINKSTPQYIFVLRTFSSIRSISSISTSCMVLLKVKYRQRFYNSILIILVGLGDFGQTPGPSSVLFWTARGWGTRAGFPGKWFQVQIGLILCDLILLVRN